MSTKKIPRIYIVLLTCNAKKLVLNCLASLRKIDAEHFQVKTIVVDNGSKDAMVGEVGKQYPEAIVIDNRVNYGFAKGINYGLKLAYQQGADYLLLLNDDTLVTCDFLVKLVKHAKDYSYFICGPKILTREGKIWSLGGKIDKLRGSGSLIGFGQADKNIDKDLSVDFISGTAMLVNRKVIEKIGFLDEDYFLYYDDVDFCYRAKKAGFQSVLVPVSAITHRETATIQKNSPSHYYHAAKSHLIFVIKRLPLIIKLREFIRVFKTIFELMIEKDKTKKKYELLAIWDFLLCKFGQNSSIKPF